MYTTTSSVNMTKRDSVSLIINLNSNCRSIYIYIYQRHFERAECIFYVCGEDIFHNGKMTGHVYFPRRRPQAGELLEFERRGQKHTRQTGKLLCGLMCCHMTTGPGRAPASSVSTSNRYLTDRHSVN